MKQETEVKDMKKKQKKLYISAEKFGAGSSLQFWLAASSCLCRKPGFSEGSRQNHDSRACLLVHSADRYLTLTPTAYWAALKFSPGAVMFVIMWIILWPESSLYKHRNCT